MFPRHEIVNGKHSEIVDKVEQETMIQEFDKEYDFAKSALQRCRRRAEIFQRQATRSKVNKNRVMYNKHLNTRLYNWIEKQTEKGDLQETADEFFDTFLCTTQMADSTAIGKWLWDFKKRHGVDVDRDLQETDEEPSIGYHSADGMSVDDSASRSSDTDDSGELSDSINLEPCIVQEEDVDSDGSLHMEDYIHVVKEISVDEDTYEKEERKIQEAARKVMKKRLTLLHGGTHHDDIRKGTQCKAIRNCTYRNSVLKVDTPSKCIQEHTSHKCTCKDCQDVEDGPIVQFAILEFRQVLKNTIAQHRIVVDNVYTMADTRLMWRSLPASALRQSDRSSSAIYQDLIALGLCANVTGTHKLPLLFVYRREPVLRVTHELFAEWYRDHFKPAVRRRQRERGCTGNVLLLIDGWEEAPQDEDPMFHIIRWPSEASSGMHPMHRGILDELKKKYRYSLLRRLLSSSRDISQSYSTYDFEDCMELIAQAWDQITPGSITDSWGEILPNPNIVKIEGHEDLEEETALRELTAKIPAGEVLEWLSQCQEIESGHAECDDADSIGKKSENMDSIFHSLYTWAQKQPKCITDQVDALIAYYNQT